MSDLTWKEPGEPRGIRRRVTHCVLSSHAGDSGSRWALRLECGHEASRRRQSGKGNGSNWKYYPAPKYIYCRRCLVGGPKVQARP